MVETNNKIMKASTVDIADELLECKKLKKQNAKMLEALKKVRLSLGMIPHNWHRTTKGFMPEIIEILKDLE